MKNEAFLVPADVPQEKKQDFINNYNAITKNTSHLLLFAGDQKIEHLNTDFYGKTIHPDANQPQHLFEIAQQGTIGVFATQMGMIARYGMQYPDINYLVKLNSKTDIIPHTKKDPISSELWSVLDVVKFKEQTKLNIRGIGYTIYLGSKYESIMLHQAAQAIYQAHQHGMIAILWMYPRGAYVTNEKSPDILAGAAGVANALGADFVKINAPQKIQELKQAVLAAGNTKIICSGGSKISQQSFLENVYHQIAMGTAGCATGRNIYQQSKKDAITMTRALTAIIYEHKTDKEALSILNT